MIKPYYTEPGKYSIIYADPPWSYNDKNCNGACLKHYQTMTDKDIWKLPVGEMAEKDCVLFMWATYPKLKEGLKTIEEWGFEYKTIAFQWVKTYKHKWNLFFGLGRWTRGNTEPCLLAVKGKPKRKRNDISQIILEPVGRHSQKPDIVRRKIVELMGDLPRIELFARERVEGWDAWGNEINKEEVLL
jgi:N6-adenosine-specific RNA methylase IME4